MRSPILYFFLFILEVLFNLSSDTIYEQDRFSKTLSKNSLEFVLSKRVNLVLLLHGIMLLPLEFESITDE